MRESRSPENANSPNLNKRLYSGPMAPTPEYQSLRFTDHIKSCPTYWHHILIFTQVFYHFNLETPQRPFHNLHSEFSIYLNTTETHPFPLKSPVPLLQPRGCPHQFAQRKPLPRRANQRASSGHVIVCCHHIDPRATMTTRLLMIFKQVKQLYDVNL